MQDSRALHWHQWHTTHFNCFIVLCDAHKWWNSLQQAAPSNIRHIKWRYALQMHIIQVLHSFTQNSHLNRSELDLTHASLQSVCNINSSSEIEPFSHRGLILSGIWQNWLALPIRNCKVMSFTRYTRQCKNSELQPWISYISDLHSLEP